MNSLCHMHALQQESSIFVRHCIPFRWVYRLLLKLSNLWVFLLARDPFCLHVAQRSARSGRWRWCWRRLRPSTVLQTGVLQLGFFQNHAVLLERILIPGQVLKKPRTSRYACPISAHAHSYDRLVYTQIEEEHKQRIPVLTHTRAYVEKDKILTFPIMRVSLSPFTVAIALISSLSLSFSVHTQLQRGPSLVIGCCWKMLRAVEMPNTDLSTPHITQQVGFHLLRE